jgi:hypothetical protein
MSDQNKAVSPSRLNGLHDRSSSSLGFSAQAGSPMTC